MPARHQGIILLGAPRSGTTLLRRLLDAHPRICCPGETFLLRASAKFIESERIAGGIEYGVLGGLRALGFNDQQVLAQLRGLCFGFLEQLAGAEGKPRWAAKTAVDSFYVNEIERIYGGHACFIVLVRHGLDVVCSFKEFTEELRTYISELHAYLRHYPRPLEAFAHAWVDVTQALMAFAERNDQAIVCRYEDLVSDPPGELRRLLEFVGEEWHAPIIEAAFDKPDVKGLGDWKGYGRTAVDGASVGRWRSLPEEVVSELADIVNPTLERCGYARLDPGRELGADEAMRRYELAMMLKASRARAEDEVPEPSSNRASWPTSHPE